jgi:sugar/nucleoside kinase (ribokinase family)
MFDLFCIGGCSVDYVVKTPRLPFQDEKLLVEYGGRQAGGLVANTACAAARLGLKTGWSGWVGGDENGELLREDFSRFGVDASFAAVAPGLETDFTVILVSPDGDRTILVVPVNKTPIPLSPATLSALKQTRIGYSLPQNPEWFREFSKAVRMGGGKVAADLEGSSPVKGIDLESVLKMMDIAFCSLDGLELCSGTRDPIAGAGILLQHGLDLVIVTMGKMGSAVYRQSESYFAPAFSVSAEDTTGAGDCFHAAFLAGMNTDWSFGKTLRFASAAAALSVQGLGARGALPTFLEIEAFLLNHKEI